MSQPSPAHSAVLENLSGGLESDEYQLDFRMDGRRFEVSIRSDLVEVREGGEVLESRALSRADLRSLIRSLFRLD